MFSFVGDTILDPFAGTGSTAVGASRIGRNSVNTEIEPNYVDIAEKRIRREQGTLTNYQNLSIEISRQG
jgi:DNA modification methylase